MPRLILIIIGTLYMSCDKDMDSVVSTGNQCLDWGSSCNVYHQMEDAFEEAWFKKDTVRILGMINSMYDSVLNDEQFLDRFMILASTTGVLPIGSYELCDSCWINKYPIKQKKRYREIIVGVYQEYIKNGNYYLKDTTHRYSMFVNTKYDIELDSGFFTPKQYLDTLDFFIKNKIQVDLGG